MTETNGTECEVCNKKHTEKDPIEECACGVWFCADCLEGHLSDDSYDSHDEDGWEEDDEEEDEDELDSDLWEREDDLIPNLPL